MTVLGSFIRRSAENPTKPLTDATLVEVMGGPLTDAGVNVNPETAYQLTAIYRCIALLSGLIGALPLHAYRRVGDARQRIDLPVVTDPHPDKTAFEVWEFLGQSLLSWGNSYALKQRDGLDRIRELEPLHPKDVRVEKRAEWVSPNLSPTGKRFFVRSGTTEKPYTPFDLLHVPGLSYDGLVGMSPIGMARQGIGLALAAERFGAKLFSQGALVQGVLQTDQALDEDAAKRLKAQWREKTAGGANHWSIPILDSGAKYEPIALPPEDVQYIESRRFSIQEAARLYGIPPHLIGDVERSTSWGAGIEAQNMQMLTFTADPWLVRIEERVTKEVAKPSKADVYVKHNRSALLRADTAARFLAYQRAITNGWMNADEIRALEEMDPLPDGQGATFYRPGNIVPVDEDDTSTAEIARMLQQVYLAVGKVITVEEARELLNREGAGLTGSGPSEGDD
jgi:HK97 family phage portal protein